MIPKNIVIDTCDHGHKFAKLPDHPAGISERYACPHCCVAGLKLARAELKEYQSGSILNRYLHSWDPNLKECSKCGVKEILNELEACPGKRLYTVKSPPPLPAFGLSPRNGLVNVAVSTTFDGILEEAKKYFDKTRACKSEYYITKYPGFMLVEPVEMWWIFLPDNELDSTQLRRKFKIELEAKEAIDRLRSQERNL